MMRSWESGRMGKWTKVRGVGMVVETGTDQASYTQNFFHHFHYRDGLITFLSLLPLYGPAVYLLLRPKLPKPSEWWITLEPCWSSHVSFCENLLRHLEGEGRWREGKKKEVEWVRTLAKAFWLLFCPACRGRWLSQRSYLVWKGAFSNHHQSFWSLGHWRPEVRLLGLRRGEER